VAEYDGSWEEKARYIHTLTLDDPLALTRGADSYFYHKDGLGSVANLTDASGNIKKGYTYRSFGEIHRETGSLVQPFTFTGREYDLESGLYYYRARYYDPKAARFLTQDPIGFAGGDVNLYRYVHNNPVSFRDHGDCGMKTFIPESEGAITELTPGQDNPALQMQKPE